MYMLKAELSYVNMKNGGVLIIINKYSIMIVTIVSCMLVVGVYLVLWHIDCVEFLKLECESAQIL